MARASKDAARTAAKGNDCAKGPDRAEEKRAEEKRATHAEPPPDAAHRLMRAQADLEAARLELQEHKRRSSQQTLVASEALKEARRERDQLRMQLDAARAELESPRKRRRETGNQGRDPEELAAARAELEELRDQLEASRLQASAAEDALAKLRRELAELQSAHAQSKAALANSPAPVEEDRRGFFGKLFGKR